MSLYKFQTLPPEKKAWLAGLYQGEAYFSFDSRVRSKSNDPDYTPPPPAPNIILSMVEKDLITHVAKDCLDENVRIDKRQTNAGKTVYKVAIGARPKVEAFLQTILPYVVGELKRKKIQELLDACEQHRQWKAAGGRRKAAQLAARASAKAKAKAKAKADIIALSLGSFDEETNRAQD